MASIKDIERKEFLLPVVTSAVTAGGAFAARKLMNGNGTGLTDKIGEKVGEKAENIKGNLEDAGGPVGMAAKAAEKLGGGGSGGPSRGSGWGRGRRLPIQQAVDVAVPVEFAYERWTDFKKLGNFLHRVEKVEEKGDKDIVWHENIWGRRRTWRARILAKKENELLQWQDDHGIGVLSFHRLAPRLTRVEVNYDWVPHGMVEKMASGLRFHNRAAKTDMLRFKAYSETQYAKQVQGDGRGNSSRPSNSRERSGRSRESRRA
jgi:uncharacterized membrane protein